MAAATPSERDAYTDLVLDLETALGDDFGQPQHAAVAVGGPPSFAPMPQVAAVAATASPVAAQMAAAPALTVAETSSVLSDLFEEFKEEVGEAKEEQEDPETHYNLGVAFKEMGLLDEAIAEFQKALRAPEGRLRTSEALGTAFFDKGQFGIAETVLRRAVDTEAGGDEAKIGLLYWLGRAVEAQGKAPEALRCYERALAVDIRFMDLGERVPRLAAERHA
jgi:tetratricopeptide (TPR) repeat protein